MRPRRWLSELLKPRAFVRSDRDLEEYTWDVPISLLEIAGAEAGGTPRVRSQQDGSSPSVPPRSFFVIDKLNIHIYYDLTQDKLNNPFQRILSLGFLTPICASSRMQLVSLQQTNISVYVLKRERSQYRC